MSIDDFVRYSQMLHGLTADFVRAVPEDKWDFSPDPPGQSGRPPASHRTPFTFALFTWEFVQHEAIHHGQWSMYASLAGFDTPLSWRTSWGM